MAAAPTSAARPDSLRLFNVEFAGQISWLIPFALVALVTGLWARRHADRTDRAVAGYLLWGTWFAVHALVFSFMSGIVHTYYAVALAPAVAALVGAGVVELWRLRERSWVGGLVLGGTVARVRGLGVGCCSAGRRTSRPAWERRSSPSAR